MTSSADPAVRSMDTMWFAVDADGHVAVFESRAAGAVPTVAYLGDDWHAVADAVLEAGSDRAAAADADIPEDDDGDDDELQDDGAADEVDEHEDRARRFAAAGLHVYTHLMTEDAVAGPYERTKAPEAALTVGELPDTLVARMAVFAGRFVDTAELQPAEHWPVESARAAWLSSDGTTLRCLPGRDAQYAHEVADLREFFADGELVIEPPPPPSGR